MFRARYLLVLCAAAGCQQTATPPVQAPAVTVKQAGYYEPVLNLELDFGDARSPAILEQAGNQTLSIGRALISGKSMVSGKLDTINFVVLGGAGGDASVGRKIAHYTFPAQELRQLANMGVDGNTVLDSARDVGTWLPNNDDVVGPYCKARHSSAFCEAVGS